MSFSRRFLEYVTLASKDALNNPISNGSIPYTDINHFILKYIVQQWRHSSDQQIYKLYEMHFFVDKTAYFTA